MIDSIFKDGGDSELVYWPVSPLVEGIPSQTLSFSFVIPPGVVTLRASASDKVSVWAKKSGSVDFQNITESGIILTTLPKVETDFECYLLSSDSPDGGFERVVLSIGTGSSSSAGWAT